MVPAFPFRFDQIQPDLEVIPQLFIFIPAVPPTVHHLKLNYLHLLHKLLLVLRPIAPIPPPIPLHMRFFILLIDEPDHLNDPIDLTILVDHLYLMILIQLAIINLEVPPVSLLLVRSSLALGLCLRYCFRRHSSLLVALLYSQFLLLDHGP